MKYFTPAFLKFFKDLAKNNNSEWFDTNRKVYETEVKKPFVIFVEEMISQIQKHEPAVKIKASDAIMRINKDIRFSKDKTPYNTHVAANISVMGKKDKSYPGFYFQFSAEKIMLVGGSYIFETPMLLKVRDFIVSHRKEFKAAYSDKNFIEKFGTIQGEKNKRLSEDHQEISLQEPLIANKQFYYTAELKADELLKEDLADKLMTYYTAGRKMNEFLEKALKN